MFRLVRFLIITLTLGRIKWVMRLTWVCCVSTGCSRDTPISTAFCTM